MPGAPPIPACGGTSTRWGKSTLHLPLVSYVMNNIPVISHLRWLLPLWCLRHHLPPRCAVGLQPVLNVEQLLRKMIRGALLCHRLRGKGGGASHQRGDCFSLAPKARLTCFPTGKSPVVWFSQPPATSHLPLSPSPARAVVKVLYKLAPSINLKAPPQPSAAKPLSVE